MEPEDNPEAQVPAWLAGLDPECEFDPQYQKKKSNGASNSADIIVLFQIMTF